MTRRRGNRERSLLGGYGKAILVPADGGRKGLVFGGDWASMESKKKKVEKVVLVVVSERVPVFDCREKIRGWISMKVGQGSSTGGMGWRAYR